MLFVLAPGVLMDYRESWTRVVSLICCSTHVRGMFLPFRRIVSDVGKRYIAIENVKLFAFNTPSNFGVCAGQWKREKAAGTPYTPCSFICASNKPHRLSAVCKAVWWKQRGQREGQGTLLRSQKPALLPRHFTKIRTNCLFCQHITFKDFRNSNWSQHSASTHWRLI